MCADWWGLHSVKYDKSKQTITSTNEDHYQVKAECRRVSDLVADVRSRSPRAESHCLFENKAVPAGHWIYKFSNVAAELSCA